MEVKALKKKIIGFREFMWKQLKLAIYPFCNLVAAIVYFNLTFIVTKNIPASILFAVCAYIVSNHLLRRHHNETLRRIHFNHFMRAVDWWCKKYNIPTPTLNNSAQIYELLDKLSKDPDIPGNDQRIARLLMQTTPFPKTGRDRRQTRSENNPVK